MVKNLIKKLLSRLDSTLNTHTKGWSARKVTVLMIVIMAVIVGHVLYYNYATKKDNWTLFPEILALDYFMITVLLGLTTWQALKSDKNDIGATSGKDKTEPS